LRRLVPLALATAAVLFATGAAAQVMVMQAGPPGHRGWSGLPSYGASSRVSAQSRATSRSYSSATATSRSYGAAQSWGRGFGSTSGDGDYRNHVRPGFGRTQDRNVSRRWTRSYPGYGQAYYPGAAYGYLPDDYGYAQPDYGYAQPDYGYAQPDYGYAYGSSYGGGYYVPGSYPYPYPYGYPCGCGY
jgi:hypothetical protein